MIVIGKAELYAGRKRLKALRDNAAAAAHGLIEHGEAAESARDGLRFHSGLKTRNLDAVLVVQDGEGRYISALKLRDTPRGMPDLIGAPGAHETPAEAQEAGYGLLIAAMVMILDHKRALREGTAQKIRRFEVGEFAFGVPEEIISVVGKEIPAGLEAAEKAPLQEACERALRRHVGHLKGGQEGWEAISDNTQVDILMNAARLLCLNVNMIEG
ncbi:hypothetical protein [Leisingera caerulea]|uniref:hypothetical protein n=1 Tax=Leisingera caerulea TaxID=506591 RepID=UPI00040E1D27|nr:hypothetical protein [Leisingera caerulea]